MTDLQFSRFRAAVLPDTARAGSTVDTRMKGGWSVHPAAEDLLCAAAGEWVRLMVRRARKGMGDIWTAREAAKYVRLTLPMDINIGPHKITAVMALVKAIQVMAIKE